MTQLLFVHDADVVMHALGLVCEHEGYRVRVARSLTSMSEFRPDLVLADAYDPSVHGHGAVADVKVALSVDAPVFLFGTRDENDLRRLSEWAGADGYVSTEWGLKRLLAVVRRAARSGSLDDPVVRATNAACLTASRVLVVDQHASARERLVEELRLQGYAVRGCSDLAELERLLPQWDPDVLIADIALEGESGVWTCRELKYRMNERTIPVVLSSSLPQANLKQQAERVGADAYFCRQDGPAKLAAVLQALLSEIVM